MMNYHVYTHYLQFQNRDELDLLIEKTISRTKKNEEANYFLDMTWEGFTFYSWYKNYDWFLQKLHTARPKIKIYLIINSHFEKYKTDLDHHLVQDILFIDFFLYSVCQQLLEKKLSHIKTQWNYLDQSFVCLGGRIKPEREKLFRAIYDANLLDCSIYGLHHNTDITNYLDSVPDRDLIQSIMDRSSAETYHQQDLLIYRNLFKDCLFQVVVETEARFQVDCPWITEKTWVAIANHNPFIMFGDSGTLSELQKMGFKTFDQYLPFSDYENLKLSERIPSIVTNIKYWLKNINNHRSSIQSDIKHNFKNLQKTYLQNKRNIIDFISKNNLDCDINDLVVSYPASLNESWKSFYERIKDKNWPDAPHFESLHKLPIEIIMDLKNHDYSFLKSWPSRFEEFQNFLSKNSKL